MPRQIGLRDIHIAIVKTDDSTATTYDPPTILERAISAKLSPKSNSDNIYSDDTVEDIITAFEGVDVEIEVNQLTLIVEQNYKGQKL